MKGDLGVFLGYGVAAAALTSGGGAPPFEGTWDPERVSDLVVRLREHFGAVNRVALAVGLGLLEVRALDLPRVGPMRQRKMILLEPEKYFPVIEQGRYVAGISGDPPLAFLAEAEPLERWISVFSLWAPVVRVDAAPVAIARARPERAQLLVPDGPDTFALLEVDAGRPTRLTRDATSETAIRCSITEIARGAALGIDDALDDALMPDVLAESVMLGRRRRLVTAAFAAMLALALTLWAVNLSRRNLLTRIEAAISAEGSRPALVLSDSGMSIREKAAVSRLLRSRSRPLSVLALLSKSLPPDAVLQRVENVGSDWVIEGTATTQESVAQALSGVPRIETVRAVRPAAPSSRNGRMVEHFVLAFRVVR